MKEKLFKIFERIYLQNIPIYLFFVFIFAYSLIRSFSLSITHDEAITTVYHAAVSYGQIFNFSGELPSNSHLLNTVLVKFFVSIFGLNEFVVRIPALIGQLLYLLGTYLLLNRYFSKIYLYTGVLLLNINPFLLDFFSLSRGYGLSMGLMLLAIFFFVEYYVTPAEKRNIRHIYLAFGLFALSALANLSTFYVFAAVSLIFFIINLFPRRPAPITEKRRLEDYSRKLFKITLPVILYFGLIAAVLYKQVILIYKNNEINYTPAKSFWSGTVRSLIESSLYADNKYIVYVSILLMLLFALLLFLYLADMLITARIMAQERKLSTIFALILAVTTLIIYIQHLILGSNLLAERWALFYLPLTNLFIVSYWQDLNLDQGHKTVKNIFYFILAIYSVFMLAGFVLNMNLRFTRNWKYDADTKSFMQEVQLLHDKGILKQNQYGIGSSWELNPSINFYRIKDDMVWLKEPEQAAPTSGQEIYFILSTDLDGLAEAKLAKIHEYPLSGSVFAVNPEKITDYQKISDVLKNSRPLFKMPNFISEPDQFYSVNLSPAIAINKRSAVLMLGIIFLVTSLAANFIFNKRAQAKSNILLALILLFWSPLYLNSLYNNFYDFYDNLRALKFQDNAKRILRYCQIDMNGELGGKICQFQNFAAMSKNKIPVGSNAKIFTMNNFDVYLKYYLFPEINSIENIEQADYAILYYSANYFVSESELVTDGNPQAELLAEYLLRGRAEIFYYNGYIGSIIKINK